MPIEHRFDELDLREEPAIIAKFDEDAEPTTTVYHYTKLSNCCTTTA